MKPNNNAPFVSICGIGHQLGETLVDNQLMSKMIETAIRNKKEKISGSRDLTNPEQINYLTNPEWIVERTGIHTRYITNEPTSTLAAEAIKKAICDSGYMLNNIEFIVVATVTHDHLFTAPPTATLIHGKLGLEIRDELGLRDCATFEVSNACTSFAPALLTAYGLIKAGYKFGVVVGADKMSTTVDPADRNFRILLGDAAAALCVEATDNPNLNSFPWGLKSFFSGTDSSGAPNIIAMAGGSTQELTLEILQDISKSLDKIRPDRLWQDGKKVFKEISSLMPEVIENCVTRANLTLKDINLIFPHQANLRINTLIDQALIKRGFKGIVYNTISEVGNTTSAAVPLGMSLAWERGLLHPGMTIMSTPFGAGYTWGCTLIKWTHNLPCPI